jgi:hypothetical protein
MATNSNWTVVFDDKLIIKQKGDAARTGYTITDDAFGLKVNFQISGQFNMVHLFLQMK